MGPSSEESREVARSHLREEVGRASEVAHDAQTDPHMGRHELCLLVPDAHALQLQVE